MAARMGDGGLAVEGPLADVPTAEHVAEIIDSLPGWKSFRFPNSDPEGSVMGRRLG
jgi:hypothetical protein